MAGPRIYNLFPLLAGPVARWHEALDPVAGMAFDWIYLNPFHQPGFSGSLYAVQDYARLHPLLRGNVSESEDDIQIRNFCEAAAAHGLSVMMDLVVNHTAKDSLLAGEHPEWFVREADGSLRSPRAIDPADANNVTVWGDLAEIDYTPRPERDGLVRRWQDLVRHYVRLGIRGFRCDAAYQVPAEVWADIIAAAREVEPKAVFAAETLGCRLEEVEALRPAGFDMQFNSAKWWDFKEDWLLDQYEQFRDIAPSIAFPESHDTDRLADELARAGHDADSAARLCRQRYLFAAVFSTGVMMPMGFETGARKPLHVVETRPEDREAPWFDITGFVGETNRMKAAQPALNEEGPQERIDSPTGVLGLVRRSRDGGHWTLSAINTDPEASWVLERDDPVCALAAGGVEVSPGGPGPAIEDEDGLALDPAAIRVFSGRG